MLADIKRQFDMHTQSYRQKLQVQKDKLQKCVDREKKRGNAYKAKAIAAHSKLKSLSAAVNAAAREFPTLLDMPATETEME